MLHSWLPRSFHCDKMKSIGIMNVRIAHWQHLRICGICLIHRLLPKRMNFFLYSGSLISFTVGFKSTSRGLSITPFDTCNGILVIANRTIVLQNEWNQKPTWSWCNMQHICISFSFAPAHIDIGIHIHFNVNIQLRQMAHESTSLTAINRRSKCEHEYFFS